MYVPAEDVLGSFFGRHTQPPLADIPAALAGTGFPADYSGLAKVAARKGRSAEQPKWTPQEEPLSLNNIVPCPHPQSGMVFRQDSFYKHFAALLTTIRKIAFIAGKAPLP